MLRRNKLMCAITVCLLISISICGCNTTKEKKPSKNEQNHIGEEMTFGSYQGEEIQWEVIDDDGEKILLLSKYGLEEMTYEFDSEVASETELYWENSNIRSWLNTEFYANAFSEEEKNQIVVSISEGFPKYNGRVVGGDYDYSEKETEDYVFLLSYTEVCQYISDSEPLVADEEKQCYPTSYLVEKDEGLTMEEACMWWTSSTATGFQGKMSPVYVAERGALETQLGLKKIIATIRPAIWITY